MPVVADSSLSARVGIGRERRHVDELTGSGDGVGRRGTSAALQALARRRGVGDDEQVEPERGRLFGWRGELGGVRGEGGAGCPEAVDHFSTDRPMVAWAAPLFTVARTARLPGCGGPGRPGGWVRLSATRSAIRRSWSPTAGATGTAGGRLRVL